MSINNSQDSLPLTQENASMQNSPEPLNAFMSAPVRKLHADEYIASDLDGVTDSSTGSGNLNFLMMQAGQTDAAIASHNPYQSSGNGNDAISALSAAVRNHADAGKTFATNYQGGNDSDGSLGSSHFTASELTQAARNAPESTATASISPTSHYSTESIQSPPPVPTSSNPASAQNGMNGTSGTSGTNGTNGADGADGADGTNGNGSGNVTNVTNNTVTNNTTNNTTNNYNETNTTNNETHVSVIGGDTTEIIENVYNSTTETITNITEDVADILTTVTNNVFDTINNILDGTGLPLPSGPIGLTLDATLDQLTNLNLDLLNGGNILNVLHETLDLSPILDPLSGITGNLLSDTSLGVILDPFNYDSSANDHDLSVGVNLDVLGIDIPDIAIDVPLDAVEFLLGDIDINLDLVNDLLGLGLFQNAPGDTDIALGGGAPLEILDPVSAITSGIVNVAEDLTGDIDLAGHIGLGLLGTNDTAATDTDITIPLDLDIAGHDLVTQTLSLPLDPLEAIVGDIDIDLGAAVNVLGNVADNLFDSASGGTGDHGLLAGAGDLLGGVASELLSNVPHADDLFSTVDCLVGGLFDTAETAVGIALCAPAHTGGLDLGALLPNIGEGVDHSPLAWTESIVPDVSGLLGGGLFGGTDAPAIDPIAVAAPVVSLITPVLPVAGGLLGGHHGGLFG